MLPRFSHHREPVLNHTDPVNPRHKLRCTTDALPFAIMAGWEPLCCDILNLAYSQVYASTNLDCSCLGGTVRRRQIGLLWEILSQLVDLGLLFSAVARKRLHGARTQCRAVPALRAGSLRFIRAFASHEWSMVWTLISPWYEWSTYNTDSTW